MPAVKDTDVGSSFLENVVHFLVKLQTSSSQKEEPVHPSSPSTSTFRVLGASADPSQIVPPDVPEGSFSISPLHAVSLEKMKGAGFSGRCNKITDTCYSFWVGGSLAVRSLHRSHFSPLSTTPDLIPTFLRFSPKFISSTFTPTEDSSKQQSMSLVASANTRETRPVCFHGRILHLLSFFPLHVLYQRTSLLTFSYLFLSFIRRPAPSKTSNQEKE